MLQDVNTDHQCRHNCESDRLFTTDAVI